LGLAFAATAGSAAADPVFGINANLSAPDGVMNDIGSQGAPIVSGRTVDAGIPGAAVIVTYGVVAKPGNLGSLSSASALAPGNNIAGAAGAITDVALDNIKILDPGVAAGTPLNYSINFEIGGSIVVFVSIANMNSAKTSWPTKPVSTGVCVLTSDTPAEKIHGRHRGLQ
jgi:hypothetical protein